MLTAEMDQNKKRAEGSSKQIGHNQVEKVFLDDIHLHGENFVFSFYKTKIQ